MCPGAKLANVFCWGESESIHRKIQFYSYNCVSEPQQLYILTLYSFFLASSCGHSRVERACRLWPEDSPKLSITMSTTLPQSWKTVFVSQGPTTQNTDSKVSVCLLSWKRVTSQTNHSCWVEPGMHRSLRLVAFRMRCHESVFKLLNVTPVSPDKSLNFNSCSLFFFSCDSVGQTQNTVATFYTDAPKCKRTSLNDMYYLCFVF